jgi:multiple sugar transport system substrate-binding protein
MRRSITITALAAAGALTLTACGGGGGGGGGDGELEARGDITIWYSNNEGEIEWGKQMVEAWNADHPDEQVKAQEIPAGDSSEAVISAAITAGNAPCLIFNTSPAAVPQFEKAGGLVSLSSFEDGDAYITERSGDNAAQYASADGEYYQMPWKTNPVVIFYNKAMFTAAGLDPEAPALSTYDEFLDTARTLTSSGAAPYAIYPAPSSEFFQSWFDFYPLYAAESGGKQTIEDGKATFDDPAGKDVWNFWAQMYENGYAQKEKYNGDSFADQKAAMAVVGPWAIAVYGEDVNWGVVPVPTKDGKEASEINTFTDAKNIGLYSACKNQQTAWNVLKFATSEDQDGKLLEKTGQMPIRADLPTTYADYFASHPEYKTFADQAARTVEVPNVPNSVEIWQEIRDNYSSSVIFGKTPVDEAISEAASKADDLAAQS